MVHKRQFNSWSEARIHGFSQFMTTIVVNSLKLVSSKSCTNSIMISMCEERGIVMWILILALTILNLVFVYKNKSIISKVTIVLTTFIYAILFLRSILTVIIMMKTGIIGVQSLLWDIVNVILLLSLNISIFKNCRKVSLWLLWFMMLVLLLGNWNTLLTYIFYLKSILR